jgi:hypothetical protein
MKCESPGRPIVPSACVLLLQKLCQHGENESKRERAHNEMHGRPPLAQVRVVAHHFGFLRESREILRQTRAARLLALATSIVELLNISIRSPLSFDLTVIWCCS